jgi:ferredoxin--NADP+ reductase
MKRVYPRDQYRILTMGHEIVHKEDLNSQDYLIVVRAPMIAEKFRAGHFVVIITHPKGERIPMSVSGADGGNISMVIKRLGKTSRELDTYRVGDNIHALIGPLGNPIQMKKYGKVVFASDLVCGHAENLAAVTALGGMEGNHVISMQTFPAEDDVYFEDELRGAADEYYLTTLDGSRGITGHYHDVLTQLLDEGRVDMLFAGGDMPGLKKTAEITAEYGVPAMVTVRQIMIDATGMCGSCRVFVDGEMKLTCIDGPMFDAHKINFDDVMSRLAMFKEKESESLDHYYSSGGVK